MHDPLKNEDMSKLGTIEILVPNFVVFWTPNLSDVSYEMAPVIS